MSFTAFLQARSCETRDVNSQELVCSLKIRKISWKYKRYRQKIYLSKAKVRQWEHAEEENEASKVGSSSLFSREKRFALTRKRASPHEKKGFTSRAQTPHLDFHPSIGCARAHVFVIIAFLIQALGALKDQPLGVVLDGKRVGANMCGNWVEFVPGILGVKCTKIGGRY